MSTCTEQKCVHGLVTSDALTSRLCRARSILESLLTTCVNKGEGRPPTQRVIKARVVGVAWL